MDRTENDNKEEMILSNGKSWYLKCRAEDIAPRVILVGDPARVKMFAGEMADAKIICQEREFTTLTGSYKGVAMSVISVGIGAPSAAIVLEELWELGIKVVVRAGTALTLNGNVGDFILANSAIRAEGTSPTYLPVEYPAVADFDLLRAYHQTLKDAGAPFAVGMLVTSDGFYTELFEHRVPGRAPLQRAATRLQEFSAAGVLGADMETSAIYIVGHYLGLKTLSLLVSTVDGKTNTLLDKSIRQEKEITLVRLVLQGMYLYTTHSGA